jgi:hypothetical protein
LLIPPVNYWLSFTKLAICESHFCGDSNPRFIRVSVTYVLLLMDPSNERNF